MIDFGINRSKYIDLFIENIDWSVVNYRVDNYFKSQNFNFSMRNFIYPIF